MTDEEVGCIPQTIAVEADVRTHAKTLNQPTTNAATARYFFGATMNAKWYWPPLEGKADANSASPASVATSVNHHVMRYYGLIYRDILMMEQATAATINP